MLHAARARQPSARTAEWLVTGLAFSGGGPPLAPWGLPRDKHNVNCMTAGHTESCGALGRIGKRPLSVGAALTS